MAESTEPTKEELVKKLGSRSKDDLVSALGSKLTKEELTSVIASKLRKDELASIADAGDDQTKEQIVRKLATRAKDELVSALGSKVTKDDLVSLLGSRLKKDELAEMTDSQDTSTGKEQDVTRDKGRDAPELVR